MLNHPLITALVRHGAYHLFTLIIIGGCAIAHLFNAISSASLFQAVMPVFGFVACLSYALVCFATKKNSLLKVFFVAGAFTTFWIQ